MLSFLDVKNSDIPNVAGKCETSNEFAQVVNSACRRLLRRGDWVGTVVPIHICVRNGCLVMPRYVQTVRKLNTCHNRVPIRNLWYDFLSTSEWNHGHWGGFGIDGWWHHAHDATSALSARGQTSCYADIPGDGWQVRAYPTTTEDVGQTVTIFGVDNGNQPLRRDNGNGTWSEGWVITLNLPFGIPVTSAHPLPYVRRIDRVVKDVTQGQVRLFAYNATLDGGAAPNLGLIDLAVYDPGETTPTYARYQLCMPDHRLGGITSTSCACIHSVVALVKLRFIPARFDTDLVLPDNLDAIKDEVQAVKLREANDLAASLNFEASAIRELQRQLEDEYPDDTFSADNRVFGSNIFTNHAF